MFGTLLKKYRIKFILAQVIICLVCIELTLQVIYGAYKSEPYSIKSEPDFCLICHPSRGFGLAPGSYNVSINEKVNFNCSIGQDSFRLVPPLKFDTGSKKEVHIHGCSFPFGMGVDDSLSYPYLLQTTKLYWQIRNLAVPGNGTLQTLLLLREQVTKNELPDILVLNYASFHDERNVLGLRYRAALHYGFNNANERVNSLFSNCSFPYACLSDDKTTFHINYEPWDRLYHHWWNRDCLATVNFLQTTIEYWHQDKDEANLVRNLIIKEILSICVENNIDLHIALLTEDDTTEKFKQFIQNLDIKTIDLSLNLNDKTYTNLPYDAHPNTTAHHTYAFRVFKALTLTEITK